MTDRYQKFIQEKARNKRELLGTMFFPRTPVLLLDLSQIKKKEVKPWLDLLAGLEAIALVTLVIPPDHLSLTQKRWPEGKYIRFMKPGEEAHARQAADFAAVPGNKVSFKGCVPIAQYRGEETANYNPLQEKGNGFYFKNANAWEIFAAVVRAAETYQFPYDWENLVKTLM